MLSGLVVASAILGSSLAAPPKTADCEVVSLTIKECLETTLAPGRGGTARPAGPAIRKANSAKPPVCRTVPVSPQPAPNDPIWQGRTTGTIVAEVCDRLPTTGAFIPNSGGAPFWAPGAPPAVDPAVLARQVLASLQISAFEIGMMPEAGPDRLGAVGVPIWMWVNDPGPQTLGPLTASDTAGGVTVTLDAKVTSVDWEMGDGTVVRCAGPDAAGTEYVDAYDLTESPTCGHVYQRQGDPYTITATSHWQVDWVGAGQSGTLPVDMVSTSTRTIGELQAITVQ